MKSYFSKSAHVDREDNSIFTDIEKTRYALETAYAGFDAVQKRYKYLLQEAAKMQHSSETPKETPLCEKPSVPLVRQAFREFPFSIG